MTVPRINASALLQYRWVRTLVTSLPAVLLGMAIGLSFMPGWVVFSAIAAVACAILILDKPVLGPFAVIISQVVLTGYSEGVDLEEAIAFVVLLFVIVHSIWLARWQRRTPRRAETWAVAVRLLLLISLLSAIWTVICGNAIFWWMRELFPILNYAMVLCTALVVTRPGGLRNVLILVGAVAITATARDFLYLLHGELGMTDLRLLAVLTGWLRSTPVPLAWYLVMFGALSARPSKKSAASLLLLRLGLLAAAAMSAVVILRSGTRGYWLATFAGLVTWTAASPGSGAPSIWLRSAIAVALLAALGWGALMWLGGMSVAQGTTLGERVASLATSSLGTDLSLVGRRNETGAALQAWRTSPLVGVGFGYLLTSDARPWSRALVTRTMVHNGYVYFLLKIGVVGLISICCVLLSFAQRMWRIAREYRQAPLVPACARMLLAVLVSLAVVSISSSKLDDASTTLFLSVLAGALFGTARDTPVLTERDPG